MKTLQLRLVQFHGKIKALNASKARGFLKKKSSSFLRKIRLIGIPDRIELLSQKSVDFLQDIKSIGFIRTMDELDRRKLSIFNQLNFFQLLTGLVVPITFFFGNSKFPVISFVIASLPAYVSFLVLRLN